MAKEEKHKRTILIVILCFLLIAIIVFIILILLNTKKITSENIDQDEICNSTSQEIVQTCANQIANDTDNDYNAVLSYYDSIIEKSIAEKDYSSAQKITANKIDFFILRNDCAMAFELIDNTDTDIYPDEQKASLYSLYMNASTECGDEDKFAQFEELLSKMSERLPNAIGF